MKSETIFETESEFLPNLSQNIQDLEAGAAGGSGQEAVVASSR